MSTITLSEPIQFRPILKRIRWGGRKLGTVLGKPLGPESDYAESWEIADQHSDHSEVQSGPVSGKTLRYLMENFADELLGKQSSLNQFPLLIKFLDANDWLSLQVHPNDQQAKLFNPVENGKTEAWVIMQADPGARIIAGLRDGVTENELRQSILNHRVEDCVHSFEVKVGDCVYVPAGTVHALGPGVVLAEIQQQSNLTFRLTDWGRLDANGQPRPLHIEESMACTVFDRGPVGPVVPESVQRNGVRAEKLVECPYFVIHRYRLSGSVHFASAGHFRILMGLRGEAVLRSGDAACTLAAGQTILLPAACAALEITPQTDTEFLEIHCP